MLIHFFHTTRKFFVIDLRRQKNKIAAFLWLMTVGFTWPAQADNAYFGVHGLSYHDSGSYNNANYGLYLVYKGITGGFYDNSFNRNTYYLGYAWEWDLPANSAIDSVSLMASLATGYYSAQTPYEYSPMGALSIKHSFDSQQGVRLAYLPIYGPGPASYVLHLSYEYSLK